MKEAKIKSHSFEVGNSLSNRGHAQNFFSTLALIGAEIMGGGHWTTDKGAARVPTVKG